MNRTALRRLLAEEGLTKQAASKEEIAAWAMDSYKGDADFMVRSPSIGSGSFASHFWEGLRSHFIAQRFIRHIQESISEAKGEAAVSIESQDEGTDLYKRHAEKFLRDMYRAHGNGRQPFGDNWRAIDAWVLSKRPDLRTRGLVIMELYLREDLIDGMTPAQVETLRDLLQTADLSPQHSDLLFRAALQLAPEKASP